MPNLIKVPTAIYHPEQDIKSGDILLLNMNPNRITLPRFIEQLAQRFLNEEGGHKDIEHAGICVELQMENDTAPKKYVAHLMGRGFLIEPLEKVCDKKTVHVYRPKNVNDADLITSKLHEIILEKKDELKRRLTWRHIMAFFSHIRRLVNSIGLRNYSLESTPVIKTESNISSSSICSKFVGDVYVEACRRASLELNTQRNLRDDYMNIFTTTLPKTLQAYLSRNINYDYAVLPHAREDIYTKLRALLQKEVDRLAKHAPHKGDRELESLLHHPATKAERLARILQEDIQQNSQQDPYAKAMQLLHNALPVLKSHRHKVHVGDTTSYKHIKGFMKAQGIYPQYFDDNFAPETDAALDTHCQSQNYSSAQMLLYMHFRMRGRSDREARLEVNPDVLEWARQNPCRITAASLTGVGFLCGVIPYAAIKLTSMHQRNEHVRRRLS